MINKLFFFVKSKIRKKTFGNLRPYQFPLFTEKRFYYLPNLFSNHYAGLFTGWNKRYKRQTFK